jgi:hypothetical protein
MTTRAVLVLFPLLALACADKSGDSGATDGTDGAADGADGGTADGADGAADGADGGADGSDGSDGTDGAVSWSSDVWPVIEGHCLPCHTDDSFHPGFLITDAATTYATFTTDAPDRTGTHSTYVVSGDAAGSLLIDKIANESPAYGGERMPTNGDFISADDEQLIRDWIDQGALDN